MIRELTPEDAHQFKELRRRSVELSEAGFASALDEWWSRPIPEIEAMLKEEHASMNDFILGAFESNKLVGMVGFFRPSKPKLGRKGHVWGMFLLPEWRGQRIAGQLLDELLNRAKKIPGLEQLQLTTLNRYKASIALYRSRGFHVFATEEGSIRAGDQLFDELYMSLTFK
ncbi:MAG: GNAT family N-acetyltransferase [Chloroflexi bacterium]|nr:GNAT family N-acetyltransferase [Chloroflexota bacterium]